jgi:polyisoprenoid-binding protein YceI
LTRTPLRRLLLSIFVLLLSGCASLIRPNFQTELVKLRPGQYSLDPAHAALLFKIDHLQLSTYVGRFNSFDASLDFDPEDLGATRLSGIVEMDSLDTNDSELEDTIKGPDWFNVAQFPQATFSTVSVDVLDDSRFLFTGDLTFRGITAPVQMTGTFNGGADNILTGKYTLGFTATGSFKRSDYGMDSFAGIIGDQVDLEIFAEFLQNP